jgi:methyl-accepting chemotaxis protein
MVNYDNREDFIIMRWIQNISIKQKLLILVAFMSICIGVVGYIGYVHLKDSTERINDIYTKRLLPVKDLNMVRTHNKAIESDILRLMIETDKAKSAEVMKDIEKRDDEVLKLLKEIEQLLPPEKYKGLLDSIKTFNDQRGKIIYYTTNGKVQDGISLFGTFSAMLEKVNQELNDLADSNAALAEESNTASAKASKQAYIYLISSIVGCILLAIAVGWWFSILIANPIRKVMLIAKKVAQGDLQVERVHMRGRDEISQLANAVDEMVDNLKLLITEVRQSAGHVAASAQGLLEGSEHTSQASESAATAIQHIHDGVQKQLTSIHETTRAMEEMATGIGQIASGGEGVSIASASAYNKAKNGKVVIANTVATIEHLASAVHDSAARIENLGEKTKQINSVIELISSIAKQTNLLSLNASIEAARAGEHGRGFGVVAGEVKKLSEESSQAAYQVSEIIEEIQTETMELVAQISSSVQQAEKGLQAAHEAGNSFDEIAGEVEGVSQQIIQVSATVEQMSAGSQEILASSQSLLHIAEDSAKNTEDVTATTQETLAAMQEVRSSSATLSKLALELDALIGKFKISSNY